MSPAAPAAADQMETGEGLQDADTAGEPEHIADENDIFIAALKRDGRVYRMSRVDLHVDVETAGLIDRAIAAVDKARERGDSIEDIGQCLRSDGLDEYMTQEGWLMMPVLAARTGPQRYSNGAKSWLEQRSEDEVEASCKTYSLRPFTDDHPSDFVTPQNYTRFSKGSCGQDAMLLEPATDGHRYVRITVLVGDYATLVKVKRGLEAEQNGEVLENHKLELSAGYTCVTVRDPGVDPVTGVNYEYRQTEIIINHLALVDRGRAGPLARFSMQIDGVAWEVLDDDTRHTAALREEHDDVPNDKKDMLDPELGAQLLTAVHSYMYPESPEAKAAAQEMIAGVTGVTGEQLAAILVMPEADAPEAEPGAGAPEVPAPDAPAPGPEMVDVDIDGIKALMTPDAKAAWDTRIEEATESADSVTKAVAGMQGQISALEATVDGFKVKEQAAKDQTDADNRDALRCEISDMCPALGKAWAKRVEADSFDLSETAMREAAIVVMAPELKAQIDTARKNPKTFDAVIEGQYMGVSRSRSSAPREPHSDDTTVEKVVTMKHLKVAVAAGTYGKKL